VGYTDPQLRSLERVSGGRKFIGRKLRDIENNYRGLLDEKRRKQGEVTDLGEKISDSRYDRVGSINRRKRS